MAQEEKPGEKATHLMRFRELDALRGMAAIAVVIFHFTMNDNAKLLGWDFRYGVTAVDIFFMISGFVIYLMTNRIRSWQEFLVFRFARLYPAFWYCLLITSAFVLIYNPRNFDPVQVLANTTMFPVYFGIENLDGSYWTLLVELVFYLWLFLIFLFDRKNDVEHVGAFTLGAILLFHALHFLYPVFYEVAVRKVELLNHFPLFYAGILFCLLTIRNSRSPKTFALILVALLSACYLHDKGGRSMYHISAREHYLILGGYFTIFFLFVFNKLSFINNPILLFLGRISYCLYLIHQYIGQQLISTLYQRFDMDANLALSIAVVICIVLAQLITTFVEIPANRYIRWLFKSWDERRHDRGKRGLIIQ
ncbi:acyltransferase family protein [Dyadobacter sandarakinus]|uniref:Acyltransferase n=1 Tax=Dyadobacter sandarakinus TaxID=2747268 RepID=A0ABX7I5A1_9BACT|nr:acyltransferase [Dyadobacter sandarakinus]QRR01276.1 acyltransferase [Dyadobacter sandarakinus]